MQRSDPTLPIVSCCRQGGGTNSSRFTYHADFMLGSFLQWCQLQHPEPPVSLQDLNRLLVCVISGQHAQHTFGQLLWQPVQGLVTHRKLDDLYGNNEGEP